MQKRKETNITRRIIIGLYIQFRNIPEIDQDIVRRICETLGYELNNNGTNTYVRRTIREFLESPESRIILGNPRILKTVTYTVV